MERLIQDGRIHPAHIEKIVETVRLDVDKLIVQEGERAAFDAGFAIGQYAIVNFSDPYVAKAYKECVKEFEDNLIKILRVIFIFVKCTFSILKIIHPNIQNDGLGSIK
jgi:hypothetical protein